MTNEFIFILGNAKKLAAAELLSVLQGVLDSCDLIVNDSLATINTTADPDAVSVLIKTLGGTVKIGRLVGEGIWQNVVENDLLARPVRDVGFSGYQNQLTKSDLLSFKAGLSTKIRLVLPREGGKLNAAEVIHNKLISKGREFLIVGKKVYETLAVQEIEEFSSRDYDKPRGDYFSGMLPPKLARMMVNLAIGQIGQIRPIGQITIIDPFCGSGNVLIEAADLGYQIAGSDISEKAVQDTKANLEWYQNRSDKANLTNETNVFVADATKDDFLKDVKGLFVVVGEPYLGRPKKSRVSKAEVEREFDELAKLYLGFFENLSQVCHSEAKTKNPVDGGTLHSVQDDNIIICLVFPFCEVLEGGHVHLYNRIVDKISSLGYIRLAGPFSYGRDYQIVKREVLFFTLKR